MVNLLSIGNSFSKDAQTYLHQIAVQEGVSLRCVNLFIGGCSLETHWNNLQTNAPLYQYQENGQDTERYVSIASALAESQWDYVTLQQVSRESYDFNTYMPYLNELASFVRTMAPTAKILIHQTWAYEHGSQRLADAGYENPRDMLSDIKFAYQQAATAIEAAGIIPSGEAMMRILESGVAQIHRDTFHAGRGLGRYLLGLTWFFYLFGDKEISGWIPLEIPADSEELELAVKIARSTAIAYRKDR